MVAAVVDFPWVLEKLVGELELEEGGEKRGRLRIHAQDPENRFGILQGTSEEEDLFQSKGENERKK